MSEFRFFYNIVYCIILPFYIFDLKFTMGKDIWIIYRHSKSQISYSLLKAPVSSPSKSQTASTIKLKQLLSLMPETNIKTILFLIPKIPSRMMQPSQTMTTYSLVIHQKQIITFQPFQHLIIIHNVLIPQST